MSITFSGVGSGLPVSEMIEAIMNSESQPLYRLYTEQSDLQTEQTTVTTMNSKLASLRTSVEKFTDGNLASVFDLFKKRNASSSDDAIATVTASNNAVIQTVSLTVNSLATSTVALSTNNPGSVITGDELVGDMGNGSAVVTVTDDETDEEVGTTFSIYIDNKKYSINLDDTTTLNAADDDNSIVKQINSVTGGVLTASVQNGKFVIDVTDGGTTHDVKLGSSSDTSNFLNVMQLTSATYNKDSEGKDITSQVTQISSANQISAIKTTGTIVGEGATANLSGVVTAGSFTIGKATFTIDENTTLSDLIANINNSADANVNAVFDARTNKLKLTSKDPGSTYINLSNDNLEGTAENKSNFLSVMGLTVSNEGNADDNTLAIGSQTLGKNASVVLNGNTIDANGNTLDSDITGMYGVTINLKGTTPTKDTGTTTVDLSITQDNDSIKTTLNDFITKFNAFCAEVEKDTGSDGSLAHDYTLIRIKDELRTSLMDSVDGLGDYDSLVTLGVSTGDVGKSVEEDTTTYSLDTDTLLAALADNPTEVRALLIGDKNKGITGIFQILNDTLDSALDPVNGYIKTKKDSISTQLTTVAKSIENMEIRLENRKETLTQQYADMDQKISALSSQSTSFGIY